MTPTRKLLLFVVGLTVAGVAGGGAGYWHILAAEAEDRLAQWEAERRAEDFTVSHGPIVRSGFPLTLSFRTSDLDISRGGQWPLRWRTAAVSAEANPWTLDDVVFRFPGRHDLSAPIGGRQRPVEMALGDGRLDLLLDPRGRPRAAALNLQQLDARLADTDERYRIASARVVARRPAVAANPGAALSGAVGTGTAPAGPAAVSLETDTRVTGLALPPQQAGLLGPEISTLAVLADVIGQPPIAAAAADAARWRDAGGYVELKDVQVAWGGVEFRGAGTARLDPALQLDVRIDGRVRGVEKLIDALVAAGQMRLPEALIAKGVLAGLSRPAGDGGPPVLRVPVTVREGGRVYLGPVRVWRLPPLAWR